MLSNLASHIVMRLVVLLCTLLHTMLLEKLTNTSTNKRNPALLGLLLELNNYNLMNKTLTKLSSMLVDELKWLALLPTRAIEAVSIFIFNVPKVKVQPKRVKSRSVFRHRDNG